MYENVSKYVHNNYEMTRFPLPPLWRRDAVHGLLILEVSRSHDDKLQSVAIRFCQITLQIQKTNC